MQINLATLSLEKIMNGPSEITIGIHGVGSPPLGQVAKDIADGFANARQREELTRVNTLVSLECSQSQFIFSGLEISDGSTQNRIWEVNWADLKGFPLGAFGSLLYAIKTIIAMVQLSDSGWNPTSQGATGRFLFGRLLRAYFCSFSLVAPFVLLLIGFASVNSNSTISYAVILLSTLLLAITIVKLSAVDRLMKYSFIFLAIGCGTAMWLVSFPPAQDPTILIYSIKVIGSIETFLGILLLFSLIELSVRALVFRDNPTVVLTRAGIMILGLSIGAAAYGAIVNAVGFYLFGKLRDLNLASEDAVKFYEDKFLENIGYDVAQLELINGATTFAVGLFLVVGVVYQLSKIGSSAENAVEPRGLAIQNVVYYFLWATVIGFLVVSISTFADYLEGFRTDSCPPNTVCSLYGIQWLLRALGYPTDSTAPVSPLEIYVASAARIVPFLLPALIPPLRAGLEVAADVLLYILPPQFPLALGEPARNRFRCLLRDLRLRHPSERLSIIAHSQGTVVVRDVLQNETQIDVTLITAGSPLLSLYGRFLGYEVLPIRGVRWTNIYRPSDYIGGPLFISSQDGKDISWPHNYRAAHFLYFQDGELISELAKLHASR